MSELERGERGERERERGLGRWGGGRGESYFFCPCGSVQ